MNRAALVLALFVAVAYAAPQLDVHKTHTWSFPKGSSSLPDLLKKASSRGGKGRILGGSNANSAEFPASVFIINEEGWVCYGAIIGRMHVLSTQSCMNNLYNSAVLVAAGEVNLNNIGTSTTIQVRNAVTGYSPVESPPAPGNLDFVVIELDARFDTSNHVQVAALATSEPAVNADATVTSWGAPPSSPGDIVMRMQKLAMKISSDSDLGSSVNAYDIVGARAAVQGNGACDGDAGAPLYTTGKQLIGVLSMKRSGSVCGDRNPVGFTSAVYHRDWINCAMDSGTCKSSAVSSMASATLVMVAFVIAAAVGLN